MMQFEPWSLTLDAVECFPRHTYFKFACQKDL